MKRGGLTAFLKIAFRNLGRHKAKTIITCAAITIGITSFLYLDAMMLGMRIEAKRNLVNYQAGSAKIYTNAYFDEKDYMPLYEGFKDYRQMVELLDKEGFNASPAAKFQGTLIYKDTELPFVFSGIEPDLYDNVFGLEKYIIDDGELKKGHFNVVLGINGARKLGVKVGDVVKLFTIIKTRDEISGEIKNTFQVILLRVSGLLKSPNMVINGNYGFLPLDILQDEKGLQLEGMVTEIVIRKKSAKEYILPGEDESPGVIRGILGGALKENLKVVSWLEDNEALLTVMETKTNFSQIIIGVLVVIVIIGVSNTMLMAVLERTKEIGMLRALGMTNGEVLLLFMIEAAMIGLIGALLGVIVGSLVNLPFVVYGLDFSELMESAQYDEQFSLIAVVHSAWNAGAIVFSLILMPLVSGITAFFPARRAIKMNINDALRFE